MVWLALVPKGPCILSWKLGPLCGDTEVTVSLRGWPEGLTGNWCGCPLQGSRVVLWDLSLLRVALPSHRFLPLPVTYSFWSCSTRRPPTPMGLSDVSTSFISLSLPICSQGVRSILSPFPKTCEKMTHFLSMDHQPHCPDWSPSFRFGAGDNRAQSRERSAPE